MRNLLFGLLLKALTALVLTRASLQMTHSQIGENLCHHDCLFAPQDNLRGGDPLRVCVCVL